MFLTMGCTLIIGQLAKMQHALCRGDTQHDTERDPGREGDAGVDLALFTNRFLFIEDDPGPTIHLSVPDRMRMQSQHPCKIMIPVKP